MGVSSLVCRGPIRVQRGLFFYHDQVYLMAIIWWELVDSSIHVTPITIRDLRSQKTDVAIIRFPKRP
jgi:hypothetical protein